MRGVTGAPILFASTGEGVDDFERFHADRMAGRILDMGDVLTLIEQAEKRLDAEEAEKMAAKVMSGELTLADFLSQLQQVKKLGSMKKMLGMIPGAAQMREQIENLQYLVNQGYLLRPARGVYTLPDVWEDDFLNLQTRFTH